MGNEIQDTLPGLEEFATRVSVFTWEQRREISELSFEERLAMSDDLHDQYSRGEISDEAFRDGVITFLPEISFDDLSLYQD